MTKPKTTLEKHIFKAGFFILIAHQLFKLASLIQAKAMGHYLPSETFDIVYVFAFENCIYLLFLLGEEVLIPAFMPVFLQLKSSKSEEKAWEFANTIISMLFMLLLIIVAGLITFPDKVVLLLTHWHPDSSPDKFTLAAKTIRTLAPALLGISLGSLSYVLLNSYKRFFIAALGNAVWKFAIVIFLLTGSLAGQAASQALIWGILAGSLCKLATHLGGLRDKLRYFRLTFSWSNPAVKTMCWLALPLLAGALVAKMRDQINHVYLLSSLEQSGLMQANSMGRKLQSTLLYLVPYTLSIAAFPYFCELVSKNDFKGMANLVNRFGRILMLIFMPIAILVAITATPLTSLIFGGGYFDQTAIQRTALTLTFYTFALPAAAIETILMQAFFANRRMISVTVIGIVFSTMSMLTSWAGIHWFHKHDLIVLGFIAGGFTLSRILKCLTLVQVLKQNVPIFPFKENIAFILRLLLASLPAAGVAWLAMRLSSTLLVSTHKISDILQLLTAGSLFCLLFIISAIPLKIIDIQAVTTFVTTRIKHFRK